MTVFDGQGIRLRRRTTGPVFNDFDLYLIGLMRAEQVEPQVVFAETDARVLNQQCNGMPYTGEFTTVTVDDIINEAGPRDPPFSVSQKHFRMGTIVVSKSMLDPDTLAYLSFFTKRAEEQKDLPIPLLSKLAF